MNNPDEDTAVDQFGKGDKYFGVCTMMATMPGLPMFGHGQIEGLRREVRHGVSPRHIGDETPDPELVAAARARDLPAAAAALPVRRGATTSCCTTSTRPTARSTRTSSRTRTRVTVERSLVIYHNRYAEASGSIRTAAVTGSSLAHGLSLTGGADDWLIMRDDRNGLEHLRSQRELAEHGLALTLHAYETQVYTQLRDVHDHDGRYGRLAVWLGGRAVPSVDDAMRELELQPLHNALRGGDEQASLAEAAALLGVDAPEAPVAPGVAVEGTADERALAKSIETLVAANRPDTARGKWIYDWLVDRVWSDADLIALQLDLATRPKSGRGNGRKPVDLLADDRFRRSIGVNEHDGVTYFNRERFSHAVEFLALPDAADLGIAAHKSRYRLDDLKRVLGEPPKWASTAPVRRTKSSAAAKPAGADTSTAVTKPVEKTPTKSAKK